MSSPHDDEQADAAGAVIVVTVTRTGGIAGLRREWSAAPPAQDEQRWVALIESCPWDVTVTQSRGADRYTWRIDARCGTERREAQLPDQAVAGPWRDLVDEVQQASTGRR
jgi:hypothetical protein